MKGVKPADMVGIQYLTNMRKYLIFPMKRDFNDTILPVLKANQSQYVRDSWVVPMERDSNDTILPVFTSISIVPMKRDSNDTFTQYVRDSWFTSISTALETLKTRWTGENIDRITQQIGTAFVRDANRVNATRSASAFGINILVDLTEYLEASVYDNVQLIRTIPEQYMKNVESIVMNNVRSGGRWSAVQKQLVEQFGITDRRARVIARDQTAKINGQLNAKRQVAAGYEYFEWDDSGDSRVRKQHRAHAEKITEYGKGVYRWDNPPIGENGVPVIPGTEFQCFPGDSQLDNAALCNKLYRRRYTGELSELVFNDGTVLRSTRNHPILTDVGFKPAHLINHTDNIVRTFKESLLSIELNRKGTKPTFEQIFSAFNLLGVESGVSSHVEGEFHGDVSDGDVEIIELDRLLVSVLNPSIIKKLAEHNLTRADQVIIFNSFTCLGEGDFGRVASRNTLSGFMSRKDLMFSSFLGHLTPLESFAFALGTWYHTEADKLTPDYIPGKVEMFSDCVFAFAVLIHGNHLFTELVDTFTLNGRGSFNTRIFNRSVNDLVGKVECTSDVSDANTTLYKLDNVISNRSVDFSGHVYNLQTISGDYNTGATVVSNCRCVGIPRSFEDVEKNRRAGNTRPGVKR